ncbi:MAG TPA: DUF6159 family protein [Thermoanaerobaculia bacterium]|nr:DUF6159 family protein [Thermoanaerobaculia bacterium]
MFETFRRSYQIFRESLSVLRQDKEILIFPLLSGILTVLALGGLIFGGVITGFFARFSSSGDHYVQGNILGYTTLFVWYFVSWFIILFFNVAVVQCAKIRLDGGDPTAGDGFRAAAQHLSQIVVWALISASVGVILRMIAERSKLIGRIITGFLGGVWAIATYFIVPVMIFEKRGVKDSITQSTELVRKTWGESLVAAGGVGLFITLLAIPGVLLPIGGMMINIAASIVGFGFMILYWLALAVVSSALTSIYRTSLYLYATEGRTPPGFSEGFIKNAFKEKKGSRSLARA